MLHIPYDKINVLIGEHVPLRRSTDDFPLWFSKKLRNLIKAERLSLTTQSIIYRILKPMKRSSKV